MSAGMAVVECLRAEGIRHICGVAGSSYQEVLDSLYGRDDIQFIGTRHEQGGAFMAVGYSQALGSPSVCMATNGPGSTNLVTGIAGALMGHSPVVAIVGGISMDHMGRDAIQEIDQISLFRPITKLAIQINRAERIPELLRHAFRVATTGKMGPVLVEIPRDLLNVQEMEADVQPPAKYRVPQAPEGDQEQVRAAAEILRQARFPVVVAGGGVKWSQAAQEVLRLAELLAAPIINSYGHNDAVPNNHPLYIGPLGRAGAPEAAEALQQADVVLAVGTRLGQFTTFFEHRHLPREARLIQIEIDGKEIGRNFPVTAGIQGDARAVLTALLRILGEESPLPGGEERRQIALGLKERRQRRLDAETEPSTQPLKPQRVFHELRRVVPPQAAVVFDAGAATGYGYDRLPFTDTGSFFCSLELGCVGSGLPMALGVKLARPECPVVCISGDGGFMMNSQEMETAVRHGIAVVNIVLNNNCWGAEKAYQKHLYDGRYVAADITNPRFDRYAELCGALGFYAESPREIANSVHEALASERPAVIEVPIDPEELPFPARADVFRHRLR
ncbi:MAG: thiamine pyrophosphate-binding protein [Dehalococcoidia bacterium]|nr:thiamine pyrophosphate-binding protein [Dehalococcoidia bacterium]